MGCQQGVVSGNSQHRTNEIGHFTIDQMITRRIRQLQKEFNLAVVEILPNNLRLIEAATTETIETIETISGLRQMVRRPGLEPGTC
jgi:hypothetical protein